MPVSSRVSRSESLRSEVSDQSKRVSFHRSVDIKRIPKIAEQPKPVINDKEILLREARDVVKSIDSVQCSVGGEIPGKTSSRSNSATIRRENNSRASSRGNSVDRIISVNPAPSKLHSNSNGFHTSNKGVGSRSSVRDSSSRDNSVSREIHSRANSVSRINPPPYPVTTKSNQSNSINKAPEKTVINRVSGTLKRVKSAVNKKKVPPPPKQTQTQKTTTTNTAPLPPPAPTNIPREVKPVAIKKKEKSPEMTRNPRVSSLVDKLSNMKTSPPPFQYDSQPFSYISGRPKLSSPKEVIYAQVVVGDKDKRTVHRSVRGGGYNRTLGYGELEEESYSNKINGGYHHDYGSSNKNGGYSAADLISNNDSDYLDEYLKTAKPRANVTTVLLNNVDDEDFTVEKSHFRFRSVSPKNYNTEEDYSFKDNGFSYGSLGRYNNSTTSSSRYRNGNGNGYHREQDTSEMTFNGRNYEDEIRHKKYDDGQKYEDEIGHKNKYDDSTGYYNHETKDTTMYFGDYYDYKENKKDTFDSRHDDFKLDAKIDKWRDHHDITYEDEREYKDKYDDYYPVPAEDKYLKKYDHYESHKKEDSHQEKEEKKTGKVEKEITSTRLVKEIEKTRENSLPSAKMVNNVKKESKGGIFSTLTRKEKFPYFTFNKKKHLDKEIEEVERRRDGEYHNWSSADDLYRDDVVKANTTTGDYRRNLAMRSSTMTRPVKIQEEELRSKSLDRRFKTPKIVITPNTPAVGDNKPPVFRSRENNLRYFGDTDCEDAKIAPPTQWPPPNNFSSESENGSRMSGSQRSVYLHAAAVADIPPTGLQRRTLSRDELSNHSGHQKQTRHLARSMSVLAPWRPRHYKEKYEVHYSNGGLGKKPPICPRSPTRKSPNRATSSDSLLKIDEEKEIGNNKKSGSVNRSKSMPKDSRLASWLRRKYKR